MIREHAVVLPAISTEGARSLMKRLCGEADLDVEGEYLKPYRARRGLDDEVSQSNPTDVNTHSVPRHTNRMRGRYQHRGRIAKQFPSVTSTPWENPLPEKLCDATPVYSYHQS